MSSEQRRWILNGGIASGKSAVRAILERAGVATIDADRVGHEVLAPDGPAYGPVADRWPDVVWEGSIDRGALAGIVFSDPTQLEELEAITHPLIFDRIETQAAGVVGPLVVEMPLLSSRVAPDWKSMVVDASDAVRHSRALDRGMSEPDVNARMAAQPARREWLATADMVIPNENDIAELEETVSKVMPHI